MSYIIKIRQTIKSTKKEIEFWTEEELKFFLKEIEDTYLYTPILIASMTGVRVGELCGIRWCDVDLENGHERVIQIVTNYGKKVGLGINGNVQEGIKHGLMRCHIQNTMNLHV